MNIPFVDLGAQYKSIKSEIKIAINEVLDKTAFIKGEQVSLFERNFASLMDAKHCIGVGNGTDALIVALKVLGVGPGDEVIVPANSFIATSEAVSVVGASVIFVDNCPDSYSIDPDRIESKITDKTKVIIPVHLYGQMAEMEKIVEIASRFNIKILEDSAQAHLSEMRVEDGSWKPAGAFGDMATFSFFPGKNLGAYGDAGAIITNNDKYAKIARMYSNHGRIAKYNHEIEGINSRLDNLQAAILNVKLNYIKEWTEKRREVANLYTRLLSNVSKVITPSVKSKYNSSWHLYVIRTEKRDKLRDFLNDHGVSTGVHYPIPLPFLKAYKHLGFKDQDFPVAASYQHQILSLPIYPELDIEKITYCCKLIEKFHDLN
jgi:dTDP-4-amino-4,6-dideoxygalactose transaminase